MAGRQAAPGGPAGGRPRVRGPGPPRRRSRVHTFPLDRPAPRFTGRHGHAHALLGPSRRARRRAVTPRFAAAAGRPPGPARPARPDGRAVGPADPGLGPTGSTRLPARGGDVVVVHVLDRRSSGPTSPATSTSSTARPARSSSVSPRRRAAPRLRARRPRPGLDDVAARARARPAPPTSASSPTTTIEPLLLGAWRESGAAGVRGEPMTFANPAGLVAARPWPSRRAAARPAAAARAASTVSVDLPVAGAWPSRCRAASPVAAAPALVLLFLQLLAVALLALAVADPVRVDDAPLAEHTVFIIDASGSMAADDGDPDPARRRQGRGRASCAASSPRAASPRSSSSTTTRGSLLTASPDPDAFAAALGADRATSGGGADWADAFLLAESLETARRRDRLPPRSPTAGPDRRRRSG